LGLAACIVLVYTADGVAHCRQLVRCSLLHVTVYCVHFVLADLLLQTHAPDVVAEHQSAVSALSSVVPPTRVPLSSIFAAF
jgi:hypothetical protein